jgi:tetratricopeptide (TPR) repeat protein
MVQMQWPKKPTGWNRVANEGSRATSSFTFVSRTSTSNGSALAMGLRSAPSCLQLRAAGSWRRLLSIAGVGVGLLAYAADSRADVSEQALGNSEQLLRAAEADISKALKGAIPNRIKTAEERLAVGELLRRNRDFEAAVAVFNQVIELHRQNRANESTHADAMFLLGECYFESEQLPSARRQYQELARLGDRESYAGYAGRALSRLVDIAMRRDFKEELSFVFEQLDRLGSPDPSGSLQYARGKANLAAGKFPQAIAELRKLPEDSQFGFQAQYLIGVVYTQDAAGPVSYTHLTLPTM